MIISIYALLDPETDEVRYVGKTDNARRRLSRHIHIAENDNPAKAEWVASLKTSGKTPKMSILEECASDVWIEREKHWIAYYLSIGASLTNLNGGGNGRNTKYPHQIIVRIKDEMRADITEIHTETGSTEADIFRAAMSEFIARYKKIRKGKKVTPQESELN